MNFKNVCDAKKTDILLKQNKENYVINLIKSAKSLFMSLYNLLQIELTKL